MSSKYETSSINGTLGGLISFFGGLILLLLPFTYIAIPFYLSEEYVTYILLGVYVVFTPFFVWYAILLFRWGKKNQSLDWDKKHGAAFLVRYEGKYQTTNTIYQHHERQYVGDNPNYYKVTRTYTSFSFDENSEVLSARGSVGKWRVNGNYIVVRATGNGYIIDKTTTKRAYKNHITTQSELDELTKDNAKDEPEDVPEITTKKRSQLIAFGAFYTIFFLIFGMVLTVSVYSSPSRGDDWNDNGGYGGGSSYSYNQSNVNAWDSSCKYAMNKTIGEVLPEYKFSVFTVSYTTSYTKTTVTYNGGEYYMYTDDSRDEATIKMESNGGLISDEVLSAYAKKLVASGFTLEIDDAEVEAYRSLSDYQNKTNKAKFHYIRLYKGKAYVVIYQSIGQKYYDYYYGGLTYRATARDGVYMTLFKTA